MSLESTLPRLENIERQIGDLLRDLRVLRSIRRVLRRKLHDDRVALRNMAIHVPQGVSDAQ